MTNLEPGTVLRLGKHAPVPVAWRGKTVIYFGEKDGWVIEVARMLDRGAA